MKHLFILLFTLLCLNAEDIYEADLTADEAYKMQKSGKAIIVDVRTTVEFIYTGHGEGFINIPSLYWTYDVKPLSTRVQRASFEIKNSKVKDHSETLKLYKPKEVPNRKFVKEVMQAMKLQNVTKVILVCRSGPRSMAAANLLAKEGIEAYNLEDGYIFGWKEEGMPWGGQ